MKMNMKLLTRIIDKRERHKFMVDDTYLDDFAKFCGIYAIGVYMSLCRHANKDQYCFPAIKLIAKELSISPNSVKNGIKNLKELNIINIKRKKRKDGKWKNNIYTLLDKSVWKKEKIQDCSVSLDSQSFLVTNPELCDGVDQGHKKANKETNEEGNTLKETHLGNASVANEGIDQLIGIFENINPTLNWKNKTIRNSATELINKFGFEDAINMAKQVISIQGKPYAPVATNPYQMKEKLAQFKIYFDRKKTEKKGVWKV